MTFHIKTYIATNGERFPVLFNSDNPGIPCFYPTAFISRHLRQNSTLETQLVALDGIRRLSQWEYDRNYSLEDSLLKGALLRLHEIDDLAAHVRSSRKGIRGEVISASKFNGYWAYIRLYIDWLTDELLPNRNDVEVRNLVNEQQTRLKNKIQKRLRSKAKRNQRLLDEKLPELTRAKLLSLFEDPFQELSNETHKGSRLRNIVMLRILFETGMRRGELLSLKIKSFVESSGGQSAYLRIERNHNDELDRRANQPVAKTLGRDVPISDKLEEQLIDYRVNYRAELRNVGHSEDDFIFCIHRPGRSEGQPLSKNGFNSAFSYFRKAFPILGKGLHPHAFRHDWNYRFSVRADAEGISEQDEIESREESMGWAPGSSMAKIYNQRHRREKAMEIGRKVARDTERPII